MLRSRVIATVSLVAAIALVSGCSSKKVNPELRTPNNAFTSSGSGFGSGSQWGPGGAPDAAGANGGFGSSVAGRSGAGSFDSGTNSLLNNANTNGVEGAQTIADLEMVHFDYDSYDVKPEWQAVLDKNAAWIQGNTAMAIQIEGHCDERGTEEYNMALGQRRADAVREYLVSKGVDATRLSTISYGKLRPLSFDQTEEAQALNRRGMFLVYSPDASGSTTASASNF